METATMTAWSRSRYGGPDVLTAGPVPRPTPRADEVLIEVAACALNSADVRVLRGEPLLIRLAFGLRRPKCPVPGRDVAGTVVAVGADVTAWQVGDRVAGELDGGGLAEQVTASSAAVVAVPDALDDVRAAALPLAGGTAWQALDLGAVSAGSRVLVVGAGGGVGTFAVRLAVLRGATVHALCGARAIPVVTGLGAARADDYRTADLTRWDAGGYDAVIDIAGTAPLRTLQRLVRDGGAVVGVAGGEHRVLGPLGRIARGALLSIGSRRRFRPLVAAVRPEIAAQLIALAAEGELVPPIERTWPLSDAREAIAHVDAGHTVGKVVVVR